MSDIRPLVIEEGRVQQMQDWHSIDENVMPPIVDETRAMVRSLVRYLVETGFTPPTELIEDAYSGE